MIELINKIKLIDVSLINQLLIIKNQSNYLSYINLNDFDDFIGHMSGIK
jgi:hypothetical protein